MNKKITMFIASIMMAMAMVVALPKAEVKADTVNPACLDFDSAIAYWANTPLFKEIYALEVAKADYAQVTKDNKLNYFRASLVDAVNRPDSVKGPRPLTYQFMMDMLKLSNPNFIGIIQGNNGGMSSLRIQVETEVGYFVPNAPADEKGRIASDLVGKLNSCGVTTLADYDVWKYYHGGLTAFEVWYSGYTWCGPCYATYPYGYYLNGYWWNGYGWVAYLRAANSTARAIQNDVNAFNQATAQVEQAIVAQAQADQNAVQSTIDSINAQVAATQAALGIQF